MSLVTAIPAEATGMDCSPLPRTGSTPRSARGTPRSARGYASGKDDYLARLRKIEGQVRGLQKMIEAGSWCPDVVIQLASATRALQKVAAGLLTDHLRHCVLNAARASEDAGEESITEVAGTIRQVIRLENLSRTLAQPVTPAVRVYPS
jgi:DNA-binding FrmR family transcriptional regulator